MTTDKDFMKRCFQLAKMGAGYVSPNPMVGAVIVYNGKIIGEGYHKKYGEAHAEVNAVNSVKDKSLLKDSTIYVSLEPCCHYGKTPPCAKLLVDSKLKKCVIANRDTNPKVDGGGIKILKDNGIEVVTGVMEEEGRWLNRRFFCNQEKKRPYIIIKYAQSKDGFIDIDREENSDQNYWFTNDAMKVFVHKQRAEEDAVMVGYNTVVNDNPSLTVREYSGKNPLRVVYDRDCSLSKDRKIFDSSSNTIVFNNLKDSIEGNIEYIKLDSKENYLEEILSKLHVKGIGSIIVEGGKNTIEAFLENNLWDEAYVLTGNGTIGNGTKKPAIPTNKKISTRVVGDNRLDFYINNI